MSKTSRSVDVLKTLGLILVGAAAALGLEHREELADKAKPIARNLNKKVQKLPSLFKGQGIFSTLRGK